MEDSQMLILIIAMIGMIFMFMGFMNASIKRMKNTVQENHDDVVQTQSKIQLQLDLISEKVSDINVRVMIAETRLEERAPTVNIPSPMQVTHQKRKYVRKK